MSLSCSAWINNLNWIHSGWWKKTTATLHCVCAQSGLVMVRPAPCWERSRSAVITHLSAVWNIHGQVGPTAPSQSHGFLIRALPSSCFTPPGHCAQNAASHSPLSAWRHKAGAWFQSATVSVPIGSGSVDAFVCDCLVVRWVLAEFLVIFWTCGAKLLAGAVQPVSKVKTYCPKWVFVFVFWGLSNAISSHSHTGIPQHQVNSSPMSWQTRSIDVGLVSHLLGKFNLYFFSSWKCEKVQVIFTFLHITIRMIIVWFLEWCAPCDRKDVFIYFTTP